jgi:phosphomethylpyrimidine synthase
MTRKRLSITLSDEIRAIAKKEDIEEKTLHRGVAAGRVVILKNREHAISPVAVGEGTNVKVNANIGMSPDLCDDDLEMEKGKTARKRQLDTELTP